MSQGAKVLVLGGAGGVGHFAVQIAKVLEAVTTATCGTANVDFVRSLGADFVIDYSRQNFLGGSNRYDVIFDAVGKSSFSASRHALAPGGTYVTTLPPRGIPSEPSFANFLCFDTSVGRLGSATRHELSELERRSH